MKAPSFTVGVEEEYFLVDRDTRDLIRSSPPGLMEEAEKRLGSRVSPEFLCSQIEVGTDPQTTMAGVRRDLADLRGQIADLAGAHGLAPIACSTHPFAQWSEQQHTEKERYDVIAQDMQAVVRRLVICGMHVHVGIEEEDLRIDLMNQVRYFLPHLLALSTSSPFWAGAPTGLNSYRLSVFTAMPRTGLPEQFDSWGEYRRHVDVLIGAGIIEDGTKLWWDVRPSDRFPTLEMRICDACTTLDDAVAIAALFRCLLSMLYRLRRNNQRWRTYAAMLVNENRWRAQRYGLDEGLVDFGTGEVVPYAGLLDEILSLVAEDAAAFGCIDEIAHARDILIRGTSAHRQLRVYEASIAAGASETEALHAVVDWLAEETVKGC